jgi:rubrerythrin
VFTVEEILDMAIKIEKNGEKVYRDAVKEVGNADLAGMLEWMAAEEARHAEWFEGLKQEWASSDSNPLAQEMSRQLLTEIIGDRNFSLKEVNFALIREPGQLLKLFIEFEKDSILFYELIQPFLDKKKTRELIERIILEEHRHIEHLKEFMETEAGIAVDKTD